jgi:hypothetical protein
MTDRKTIRLVVKILGLATLAAGYATFALAMRVLDQSAGAGTVDAAAVGIVAIPAGFTTTALGFLGGILASTRSTPTKDEIDEALAPLTAPAAAPLPVTIEGQADPVEVIETPKPAPARR